MTISDRRPRSLHIALLAAFFIFLGLAGPAAAQLDDPGLDGPTPTPAKQPPKQPPPADQPTVRPPTPASDRTLPPPSFVNPTAEAPVKEDVKEEVSEAPPSA